MLNLKNFLIERLNVSSDINSQPWGEAAQIPSDWDKDYLEDLITHISNYNANVAKAAASAKYNEWLNEFGDIKSELLDADMPDSIKSTVNMLSKSLDTLAASIKPYPATNKFDPAKILPLVEIGDWLNKHKPSSIKDCEVVASLNSSKGPSVIIWWNGGEQGETQLRDELEKDKPSVVSEIKADNSDDPKITIKYAMK